MPADPKEVAYCRIPEWHNAGYTGKGIKIAILEDDSGPKSHGFNVAEVARLTAPGAVVLHRPRPTIITSGKRLTPESLHSLQAWAQGLINEGVNIVEMSLASSINDDLAAVYQSLLDAGMILVTCAGNEGDRGLTPASKSDLWISVGAATLNRQGKVVRQSYSSIGEQLDVMGFTAGRVGTSFAAPWVAGMLACWAQAMLEQTGRTPTQQEALDWIAHTAEDMGDEGHDPSTGYGILRLPWPVPTFDFSYKEDVMGYPVVMSFIPAGRKNRPGTPINPQFITIHSTGNPNATAKDHASYIKSDAAVAAQVSWHYTLDDTDIYQHLPETEMGWHAGTSQGNQLSIGIEICEFTDTTRQARAIDLAVRFVAAMLKRRGWGTDRLRQHHHWSGKDCPRILRAPGAWEGFVKGVKMAMEDRPFPDVEPGTWYFDDFVWAKEKGIIKGDDEGKAKPDEPASRAEVLAMIRRATS